MERWRHFRTAEQVAMVFVGVILVLVVIFAVPPLVQAAGDARERPAQTSTSRTSLYTAGEIETLFREYGCPGAPAYATSARALRSDKPGTWVVQAGLLRFTVREATLVFVPENDAVARFCSPR